MSSEFGLTSKSGCIHKPRILHVDDDPDFLELFRALTGAWFEIDSVSESGECIGSLEKNDYAALILDYELSNDDGLELFSRIRKKYPRLPVIFYTGKGNEQVARQAFIDGAADYFVKDFFEFSLKKEIARAIYDAIDRKVINRKKVEKTLPKEEPGENSLEKAPPVESGGGFDHKKAVKPVGDVDKTAAPALESPALSTRFFSSMVILSRDGDIIKASPSLCYLIGIPPKKATGAHLADYLDKKSGKELEHTLNRLSSASGYSGLTDSLEVDLKLLPPGDTPVYAQCKATSDPDEGAFYVIISPIRERTSLLRPQNQLAAMEATMDGIAILGRNEQYVFLNHAHARIYGYDSPEELLGKSWRILYNQDERQRFEKHILPQLWKKGKWRGEAVGLRKDNTTFHQEVSLTRLRNEGLICVVRDVTRRKEFEEKLKREKNLAEKYFSIARVMMSVIGKDQCISLINDRGAELLGYESPDEVIGLNWFDNFIPEIDREESRKYFEGVFECVNDVQEYTRKTVITRDGDEKTFAFYNTVIYDEKGNPMAVLCSGEDITLRARMQKDLVEKNRELNDFVYVVSHDLKNPLNIIKGFLNLIKEEPENFNNYFPRVIRQADFLVDFIDKLLHLSRAGRVIGEKTYIDPGLIARQIFHTSKPEDVEAKLEIRGMIPKIKCDAERLAQALRNVLENSIKYRDPEKEKLVIEMTHKKAGKNVTLRIRDNGLGMTKEQLKKIFNAGYTVDAGSGTGFGLPIARKIIEAHGGKIWASSPGLKNGSEFFIRMPA